MSFWDSINIFKGTITEYKTQLMIFDDSSFEFRKMPMEDTCMVEKKNGEIDRAWAHFYSSEFNFDGYKGIHADSVTLGFNRDFILDPFDRVKEATTPSGGKPKKDESAIKNWTKEIAEGQRYKVMNKPGNMLLVNKITIFLGVGMIINLIIMGITLAYNK